MTFGRATHALAWALFLGLVAWCVYDLAQWELYRRERGCVVVELERNEHYPDKTKYRCADGTEHTR